MFFSLDKNHHKPLKMALRMVVGLLAGGLVQHLTHHFLATYSVVVEILNQDQRFMFLKGCI